jgi:hypothetical protein
MRQPEVRDVPNVAPEIVDNANQVALREPVVPILMWDQENPRSVINLLPEKVRERVQRALWEQEALFDRDEKDLLKALRELAAPPSPTDNRIRLKFWMEYDYCQSFHAKWIDIGRVVAGICSHEFFYNKYLENPLKVAWLMCPPTPYMVKANEALEFGLEQLRDILAEPHKLPNGTVDTKLGKLKVNIVEILDARVKGAVVQKTVTAHISGGAAAAAVAQSTPAPTMEDLQRQLNALKKREKELTNGGVVIDAQIAETK